VAEPTLDVKKAIAPTIAMANLAWIGFTLVIIFSSKIIDAKIIREVMLFNSFLATIITRCNQRQR